MFYKIISLTCLSLVLVACSHDDLTHSSGLPKATKDSAEFKTNPHPQQAYKVKVQVNDAPGPLQLIVFKANYQADNCEYTINRFEGVAAHPEEALEIKHNGLTNNQLEGIVYLDAMLDEDYYGQGVCRWKLVSVSAQFAAPDKDPDNTTFIIGGFKDKLFPRSTTSLYYLKEDYPKTYVNGELIESNSDFGGRKEDRNPKYPDSDWFNITMTVEENQ